MMYEIHLSQDPKTGYWNQFSAPGKSEPQTLQTHSRAQCKGREEYGCAIHNDPSDHPLMDAPLVWRTDRGILERICKHGIGHPDYDSACYLEEQGQEAQNIHGCDGCCSTQRAEEYRWDLGRTHYCDECRPEGKNISLVLDFEEDDPSTGQWNLYIDDDDCYVPFTHHVDWEHAEYLDQFFSELEYSRYPEYMRSIEGEIRQIIRSVTPEDPSNYDLVR